MVFIILFPQAHMVKINATKRNATSIAQFANKHGLKLQGERALRTAKRKRVPPLQKGRYGIYYYLIIVH